MSVESAASTALVGFAKTPLCGLIPASQKQIPTNHEN
jgi:hypothetical protein